jgi:hypothetical protein
VIVLAQVLFARHLWVGETWDNPTPVVGSSIQAENIPCPGMNPRTFNIPVALANKYLRSLSDLARCFVGHTRRNVESVPARAIHVLRKCPK